MKVRGRRYLLNRRGIQTTAAIVAEVEDTRGWKLGKGRDGEPLEKTSLYDVIPDYTLAISDCDRVVTFDFDFETAAARKNNLAKVEKMIVALSLFRNALRDEQRLYAERRRQQRLSERRRAA